MALTTQVNSLDNTGSFSCGYSGSCSATDRYTYWSLSNPPGIDTENFHGTGPSGSGNWVGGRSVILADYVHYFYCTVVDDCAAASSGVTSVKSNAGAATVPAPSSSSVTSTTATITTGTFTPNVGQSTWTVYLFYKRTVDPSYTLADSSSSSNPLAVNLTGLDSSTQYQFFTYLIRTTVNDTTTASSVSTFTTLAGEPLITTDAATSINSASATLNSTLDINAGTGVTVYWKWGTDNPPTQNTTASQNATVDASFSVGITGLSPSTTYYHQAYTEFSTPTGSPNSGTVGSFATLADPAVEAAEAEMLPVQDFDRKYGVQTTLYFVVPSPAATSSNSFYTGAAVWGSAGESKISKDGGAFADTTNDPAQVGTQLYSIVLTATEMACDNAYVVLTDAGGAVRDVLLRVRTHMELGTVDIDAATGTKANSTAFKATGYGSGHGISAVGGATGLDIDGVLGQMVQRFNTAQAGGASTVTLDASASATNDYYNGSVVTIVAGTGAGQSRIIYDYVGATKVATVHKAWATNPSSDSVFVIAGSDDNLATSPGVELAALPTFASNFGLLLQFIFQRFAYESDQTATLFQMKKADSSTVIASAAVSDDGTTQTREKLS